MARETNLAQREELLAAANARSLEVVKQPSAIARFTSAPFAIAKSVFGGKAAVNE
jgi:hypothetical protein